MCAWKNCHNFHGKSSYREIPFPFINHFAPLNNVLRVFVNSIPSNYNAISELHCFFDIHCFSFVRHEFFYLINLRLECLASPRMELIPNDVCKFFTKFTSR